MADNLEKVKPLSQTNINEVRLLLEDTPEQSIRRVVRQLPLNRSSVHQVLGKKPKMYPHRLKIVHALKKMFSRTIVLSYSLTVVSYQILFYKLSWLQSLTYFMKQYCCLNLFKIISHFLFSLHALNLITHRSNTHICK